MRYRSALLWASAALAAGFVASSSQAAFPGFNGRISFTSDRFGTHDLFAVGADGSGLMRLTSHPSGEAQSAWSPDGTRVAFRSRRDGNGEIYLMQRDGSAPVNLTNAPSQELSPDWQAVGSSPASGQSPAVGPPGVGDRTAPRLRLRVRSRQRTLRRRAVIVSVSCNERCFVTASGTIRISGTRGRRNLARIRRRLGAGARRTLRLDLSRRTRRLMKRALLAERKVSATISVRARDVEGNARSSWRLVRITG